MFHAGTIRVEKQVVFGPQGQIHVSDECPLFRGGLTHHLGSSHYILPVVWLERRDKVRPSLSLWGQVIDLTACVGNSVDLDTAVALCPIPNLLELFLVFHLLVARELAYLFIFIIVFIVGVACFLLRSSLRESRLYVRKLLLLHRSTCNLDFASLGRWHIVVAPSHRSAHSKHALTNFPVL